MILAAGASERFGAAKLLEDVDGRPLVTHAVAASRAADGVESVVVVVGYEGDAVGRAAALAGPVEVVDNPDYAEGQSTSLRAGIEFATRRTDAEVAVVLLGDQPGVTADAVRTVAAAVRDGADAARASYADGPGHPVAFARRVWPLLRAVAGDVGARSLLDDLDVAPVLVAGRVPDDVDTPADLERLRRARPH